MKKYLKINRVLLINPRIKKEAPYFPPYGLLWIAAYLEKNHIKVSILDRNVDSEDLEQVLKRTRANIVGISCLSGKVLLDVITILKIIKKFNPQIKTVLGGVHIYFFPKQSLNEEGVDFVVRGEGEETMLELVNKLDHPEDYKKIKGLGFKNKKGEIVLNPLREFIKDLNSLPDPAWHLLKIEKYFNRTFYAKKMMVLNTSRGCPNRCAFCYNQAYNKRRYRCFSADRVIKQVEYFTTKYKVDGIQFYEDEFDVDPERVKKFCQELIKRKIKIGWQFGSRVNYTTRERLKLLKQAGCQRLEFGVETGSQRLLDFICKDITIEQIKEAFRLTKEVGIKADALIMIGLPTETNRDLKKTLSLIESLPTFTVVCNIYKPYPGTQLYNFCLGKYNLKIPETFEEFANSYSFNSTVLIATDIPPKTLGKVKDEITGKNIIDTLKMGLKERRFGYLYSLIFGKLKIAQENRLFLSFLTRFKKTYLN